MMASALTKLMTPAMQRVYLLILIIPVTRPMQKMKIILLMAQIRTILFINIPITVMVM